MKHFCLTLYILFILFISASAQENLQSNEEPTDERITKIDTIRTTDALRIIKGYMQNDELRKALIILRENISIDQTSEAIKKLKTTDNKTLDSLQLTRQFVDSVIDDLESDLSYQYFKEIAQDSLLFSIFDVEGNEAQIWTNTPDMNSERYWLHKSPQDSLGFWLYSLPLKGIMLVPDFDIYQEKSIAQLQSSLLIPIKIRENPGRFNLAKFRKYPRIIFPWSKGVINNIGFSQNYYENWVKGGDNTIAVNLDIFSFLNYKKHNTEWENYIRWKYGMLRSENLSKFIRNTDLLELNSKVGFKASQKWFYSGQLNIKTQLFTGYDYSKNTESKVSDFLSPGYLSAALGMDYKPNKNLSILLSPLTGKLTYVKDLGSVNETSFGIKEGKHLNMQLGPYTRVKWKQDIFRNVNLDTSLELFSNYANNIKNVDLDWSTTLHMDINYFMSARLVINLLYDDDIDIPIYDIIGGKKKQIGIGHKLQIYENFSLGLVFRL